MNYQTLAAPALALSMALGGVAEPAKADLSPRETRVYEYGFSYGWIASECSSYEQGRLSTDDMVSNVKALMNDMDINAQTKKLIFSNIKTASPDSKCARIIDRLDRKAVNTSYTL